ncbi:hypothetical protein B7463_g3344, partial [Scytalidium lignicola]
MRAFRRIVSWKDGAPDSLTSESIALKSFVGQEEPEYNHGLKKPNEGVPATTTSHESQPPLTFTSLPTEVLCQIMSSLHYLDLFRLKMTGSYVILHVIRNFPRPSFRGYLSHLQEVSFSSAPSSDDSPLSYVYFNYIFALACKEGHHSLVLRLMHEHPVSLLDSSGITPRKQEWLGRGLAGAAASRQESTVKLVLELIPRDGHVPASLRMFSRQFAINNALLFAATNNDDRIVRFLLKNGAQPSSKLGQSAIAWAAQWGNQEIVTLLSKQIFWHKGRKLSRALVAAVRSGRHDMVKLLLGMGADIVENPSLPNSMHLAAFNGHEAIFWLLLSKGTKDKYVDPDNVHRPGVDKYTNWCCLHFAVYNKHYELVKLLLEKKVLPPGPTHHAASALPLAASRGCSDIVKLLLQNGFDVSAKQHGHTGLHLTATTNDTATMAVLLDAGANTEDLNQTQDTALHLAASTGSTLAVSLLLDRNAKKEVKNYWKRTPLHCAVVKGHTDTVRVLLKAGAGTDTVNMSGDTPSKDAIFHNHLDCLSLLLQHGADTEIPSSNTQSDLHYAIHFRKKNAISFLVQHGVNMEEEDKDGRRPLHNAARTGQVDSICSLLSAEADKHARDRVQKTALHHAAFSGSCLAISVLLEWGLDVNALDDNKQTPVHIAAVYRHYPAYDLLINHGGNGFINDNWGKDAYNYRFSEEREKRERERERNWDGTGGIGGGCA